MFFQVCTIATTRHNLQSDDPYVILYHAVTRHIETHKTFSLRQEQLDEVSGHMILISVHFDVSLREIKERIDGNQKVIIDIRSKRITFKRPITTPVAERCNNDVGIDTDHNFLYGLIPGVLERICEMNRLDDFISLLQAICDGKLQNNIALHLLLVIGQFYSLTDIRQMKYSNDSINFWLTLKKIFKGRGVNFFQGYKLQGSAGQDEWKP